mgnify:CR=1 FL=1
MGRAYRYVVARVLAEGDLEELLKSSVKELWGLRGLAEVQPSVVELDERARVAVVRVRREGLPLLRAALAVHPRPLLEVLKVTGTLRRARRVAGSLGPRPLQGAGGQPKL